MRQALHYDKQQAGLRCRLCPRLCSIQKGQTGYCRVRYNEDDVLYTKNYARCSAIALDPIEKKPLYHFYPGSLILSLGTWGCNFSCQFCQNWQLAQSQPETRELLPEEAVKEAIALIPSGNIGIAYTYSEPSVWFEYILDTAKLCREVGLKNVLVTNGYINEAPLKELLPFIDAFNIDVKAFQNDFYKQYVTGELSHVKRTVEIAAQSLHVEITTLVIPGLNESPEEIGALSKWLASINAEIPLHLSRYFPQYKMTIPATPKEMLYRAQAAAQKYLKYVYLGNI